MKNRRFAKTICSTSSVRSGKEAIQRQRLACAVALAALLGLSMVSAPWARAQTLSTLHSFTGSPDGSGPAQANLLIVNGVLYGTTGGGGVDNSGTIFKLDSQGKETVLYSFTGGADGGSPNSGLVRDKNNNLYGTTQLGGDANCKDFGQPGCGTAFKFDTTATLTVLHTFTGGTDGAGPQGLIIDTAGYLYGPTFLGGSGDPNCPFGKAGCGVIYKLDPNGNQTVLYNFSGGADGFFPNGFLSMDRAGNIYGATIAGGIAANCSGEGCGVVFKLTPTGKQTVLYTFTGGADGAVPNGDFLIDAKGNLYGTAGAGGDLSCSSQGSVGCGVVFKITPAGKERVLHTFKGPDGANPSYGFVADTKGNGYSTTEFGGASNLGTVFELTSKGAEKVLYSFTGSTDGALPLSGLIRDSAGNLYSNTLEGGDLNCFPSVGCGTVFKLKP